MRRMVLLMLCLVMTAGAYAQEIVGKWVQEARQTENGMEMAITETLTISAGGRFEESVVMEMIVPDAKDGQKATGKADDKSKAGKPAGQEGQQVSGQEGQKVAGQENQQVSGKADGAAGGNKVVRLRISCAGVWSVADGVLSQTFDPKSIHTEVLEQPDGFPGFFLNMLGKTVSSEFKKHSKKPELSKILTLTSDKLEIQSLDPKDQETSSYTRK